MQSLIRAFQLRRFSSTLRWRHNGQDSVSNHQPHDCLLNRLFRRRSKKTSKLSVTGLCVGNSPGTGEFPHKWPVTRKLFPFDDVIMTTDEVGTWVSNIIDIKGWDVIPHHTITWWRHQMETFSALLAICAGNSPVPGEFPAQRPVTRSFDVFFDLRRIKGLNKQSRGWWSETLSRPLWRHSNDRWSYGFLW